MATETRVLKELTPNKRGCFVRLNEQMCFFNGYEKPRYFDRSGRAGYLGLEDWQTATYTPTCAVSAGGSMTEGLYFSAVAVPVDTQYADFNGNFRMGNPTLPSTAVLTTATNKTMTITVPYAHPQTSLTTGLTLEADEIWIYASQGSPSATLAEEGAKYYVGKLTTNAPGSFVLTTDPTTGNNALDIDNFQPPTIRHACAMNNRIYGVVGVEEARGTVTWDSVNSRFQGKTYGAFTMNTVTSLGNNLFRIAFSGSPNLSDITTSMRISISGCSVTANNIRLTPVIAVDNTAKTITLRNEYGSTSGTFGTAMVYSTYFADGFVGAQFRFEDDGVNQLYEVLTVDVFNQRFTATEAYNGAKVAGTYYNFFIETFDRFLWWSKEDNPNAWPTENTLMFEEDLTAVAPAGEYIAVFSRNNVYTVNPRNPEEGFRKTHAPVGTLSPFSVVSCETGVFYFDGKTIRQFDGLQAQDITRRKVRVFLDNVNEALLDQVHGVYLPNEQSIRWYVPYGSTTVTNNYYVQYNISTGFWWIGECLDCTCATILEDKTTGDLDLYTGTSARFADIGQILKHTSAYERDGTDVTTTAVFGTISASTPATYTLNVAMGTGYVISSNDIGVPFNIFSATGTRAITGIIKTVVDNGSGNYTLTYHSDFDLSTVTSGDWISIGIPYFVWGIKWLDFGTPQYKHELKEIHLDFTPVDYAYGIVDFYTDFVETPNKSVSFTVSTGQNKAVIRYHGARGNQVGFRIRMWSKYTLEIRDMVVIHRTIV
jgi:hypothetical protein